MVDNFNQLSVYFCYQFKAEKKLVIIELNTYGEMLYETISMGFVMLFAIVGFIYSIYYYVK